MASTYPTTLDVFTNPTQYDNQSSATVPHYQQHGDANDAIEALEAKVGADTSAVSTSHDYRIRALEGSGAGAGTFRILAGKAYIYNPGGGGTPWHELVPRINEDSVLVFEVNETGVA